MHVRFLATKEKKKLLSNMKFKNEHTHRLILKFKSVMLNKLEKHFSFFQEIFYKLSYNLLLSPDSLLKYRVLKIVSKCPILKDPFHLSKKMKTLFDLFCIRIRTPADFAPLRSKMISCTYQKESITLDLGSSLKTTE